VRAAAFLEWACGSLTGWPVRRQKVTFACSELLTMAFLVTAQPAA
jgi:hypothetical protein